MSRHVLPDVLAPGLKIVFCGSAAGTASALARAYYAKPGNKFWPTLAATGLTPALVKPSDYLRVLEYGIGMTDMCKVEFGQDAALSGESDDARAVHACALLSQRTDITPRVLDVTLWKRGQAPAYKAIPRHRTRSVFY